MSVTYQEMHLFANDGENHTNNVKQLENMKKALEERGRCPAAQLPSSERTLWYLACQDASAPPEAAQIKKMLDGFKIPAAGEALNLGWVEWKRLRNRES